MTCLDSHSIQYLNSIQYLHLIDIYITFIFTCHNLEVLNLINDPPSNSVYTAINSGTRELTLKCKFKCYINP